MDSLRLIGAAVQWLLMISVSIYGVALALGTIRLRELALGQASSRRSRLTGVLLVLSQVISLVVVTAQGVRYGWASIGIGAAAAYILGWVFEKYLPRPPDED